MGQKSCTFPNRPLPPDRTPTMDPATRSSCLAPLRLLPAALLILGSAFSALPAAAQDASPAAVDAAVAYVRGASSLLNQ